RHFGVTFLERIGVHQKTNPLTSAQAEVVVALRTDLEVFFQALVIHESAALRALGPAIGGHRRNANTEFGSYRRQCSRLYRHTSIPQFIRQSLLRRAVPHIPASHRGDAGEARLLFQARSAAA